MSSTKTIEQLQAEADYYHDGVALLRASLYSWGLGSTARLQSLDRELEGAPTAPARRGLRAKP